MHFHRVYRPIMINNLSVRQLTRYGLRPVSPEVCLSLTDPITQEELWKAISKGNPHKAPESDGICLEVYKSAWDVIKTELLQIINHMFASGPIMAQQAQGHVVCLPKKAHPKKIDYYRPITLLNADYKILARIIANRLNPLLPDIIHPNQYCGIQGNSVFEAVASIRDTIAYAEVTKKPLCIVSIDFNAAFDRISHEYLEEVLRMHRLGNPLLDCVMGMYRNASSEVQINGF